MKLIPVWREEEERALRLLYELLEERMKLPHVNISHRSMPTWEEHKKFVLSTPYTAWYLIQVDDGYVGAIYLTRMDEIGVHILGAHRGRGYGPEAISLIKGLHKRTRYLANINPANAGSIRMFQRLGFKKLQVTYEYRP